MTSGTVRSGAKHPPNPGRIGGAGVRADLAAGWRAWAEADDGVFAVVHLEVLARG